MHTGLICLWVTGAFLLPQCLGDTDDSEYEYEFVTSTDGYIDYTDYTFGYESESTESDDNSSTIDYDLYVTPSRGIKHEQSNGIKEEEVHSGMSQINDEASTVCRYYAVGLALIVHRFCQQT